MKYIFTAVALWGLTIASVGHAEMKTPSSESSPTRLAPGCIIRGSIIHVDPSAHTIDIQNFLGKTQSIIVDKNVQILKYDQPAKLPELQSGNIVTVKS